MYKRTAKALIFVIESSSFQKELKDVSKFLFELLTDDVLSKSKLKMLIACNKQDLKSSKTSAVVRSTLEKEIELLRVISSSTLKSTGDNSKNNTSKMALGGNCFQFSDMKNIEVDFCECVAKNESDEDPSYNVGASDLKEIREWLHTSVN